MMEETLQKSVCKIQSKEVVLQHLEDSRRLSLTSHLPANFRPTRPRGERHQTLSDTLFFNVVKPPGTEALEILECLVTEASQEKGKANISAYEIDILVKSIRSLEAVEGLDAVEREKDMIRKGMQQHSSSSACGQDIQSFLTKEFTEVSFCAVEKRHSEALSKSKLPMTVISAENAAILSDFEAWNFDIFAIQEKLGEDTLVVMGMVLFERHKLLDDVLGGVSGLVLNRYLTAVRQAYFNQPYHNSLHAADVAQTLNGFLTGTGSASPPPLSSNGTTGAAPNRNIPPIASASTQTGGGTQS